MSGENNIYKYMTTDGKVYGEEAQKFTMLQYLQKSTGVFNQGGMLSKEQVKEIKQRARNGEKNLWHGFISFNEEDSRLIDTPDKCIDLIKKTFNAFFKGAGFDPSNMDLLCALHLDKPRHLHIHYLFFEKEPKVKNKRAAGYIYRKKGKISFDAIEKMTERLNAYTLNDELDKRRDEVIEALEDNPKYMDAKFNDMLRSWLKELADELPKDKPLWYASKEMKPYRDSIDMIAKWLIDCNSEALKADEAFRKELREKKEKLQDKMGAWYKEQAEKELDRAQNLKGYEEVVVSNKSLHTVEALEFDYRRRLGNIVLRHVRELQKEKFQRGKRIHYKTNDKALKRGITISERKIRRLNDKFFSAVIDTFLPETRTYHNRLHEIEEELEEKKNREEQEAQRAESQRSEYYWSK